MKIAVIGSGSMGSFYGGLLSKHQEVYLIDVWQEHMDNINEKGLIIEELDGTKEVYYPKGFTDSQPLPEMDMVIVFVKSIHTKASLSQHRHMIGKDTVLLSLQNGYGNDEDMREFASEERIIMGTTSHGCTMNGPGHVLHAGSGDTVIGSFSKDQSRAQWAREIFQEAGFTTEVNEHVQALVLKKLIVNVGINPLTALFDVSNAQIAADEHLRKASEILVKEAVGICQKAGFDFDAEEEFAHVLHVAELTGSNCSSMRADISHHRQTEIEKINGAVVNMAEKNGTQAPANQLVTNLLLVLEKRKQEQRRKEAL